MITGSYKIPCAAGHKTKINNPSFVQLYQTIKKAIIGMPPLEAQGNRPLKMIFEDHLKSLIFFHLEEHISAQHLLQVLEGASANY